MNQSSKTSNPIPAGYCFCFKNKLIYPDDVLECEVCGEEHLIGCDSLSPEIESVLDASIMGVICDACEDKQRNSKN